jgi:hypothetical protein
VEAVFLREDESVVDETVEARFEICLDFVCWAGGESRFRGVVVEVGGADGFCGGCFEDGGLGGGCVSLSSKSNFFFSNKSGESADLLRANSTK